jgi:VanZ family protein
VLKTRPILVYWLPVLFWMALIFSASTDHLSFQHSSRIIEPLVRWLCPGISDHAVHQTIVTVRKGAHLMEYAILAWLLWRALGSLTPDQVRTWSWPLAAGTLLAVLLYASSDEIHQRFVPSREASVVDVLIDTSGAALALLFLWFVRFWRRST